MKFLFILLVLAVIGVKAKPKAQADGSAGVSGGGSANVDGSANGNVDVGGCSIGGGADGSVHGNSASGNAQLTTPEGGDTSKGYTYIINAKRTEQVVPPSGSVYMYYQISDPQNMTYYERVDDDHPFILEIYVANDDAGFSNSGDSINACIAPNDGTWEYVAVKVIQGGLMPNGGCPVEKGNYDVPQAVDPITVTFSEMIPCGNYVLTSNLNHQDKWALQVGYSFTIEDDGNCIS